MPLASTVRTAALALPARGAGRRIPRSRALWGHLAVAALFCNAIPFAAAPSSASAPQRGRAHPKHDRTLPGTTPQAP